jgi:hypothetical protein
MKKVKDAVKEFNGVWPTDTKNTNYWFAGSLSNMHYEIDGVLKHICSKKEFEAYAKEQEQNEKPIYTQEMADNGELPPVGCEFTCEFPTDNRNFDFNSLNVEVIGISSYDDRHIITFKNNIMGIGCGVYPASNDWVIPIDARTDEEKLIDEMESVINKRCRANDSLRDLYKTLLEHYDITPK